MTPIPRDALRSRLALPLLGPLAALIVSGCGGGGSDDAAGGAPPPPPSAAAAAATATANSTTNACNAVRPFHWQIGDADGVLVSGSVNSGSDPTVYTGSTRMGVASASKWVYSSYFVQRTGGALSASDIKFLNFQSGYASRSFGCQAGQTVQECVDTGDNGVYDAAIDGVFSYSGAHMEKHASLSGLGAMDSAMLAAEVRRQVGNEIDLSFTLPQPAGGVVTTPDDYAAMLRKVLRGELRMREALGTHAVCTNPRTCANAEFPPTPPGENWHYSIGHWVEDDPVVGDGAFSSAGAFGFYPWIDRTKTSYGVLARHVASGALESVYCGRLIRKAWATATPQ